MAKINSLEDLRRMKSEVHEKMNRQGIGDLSPTQVQIRVAMATCGIASGAKTIMEYLISELDKRNIPSFVMQTGCMGYCYAEPTIEVTLPGKEPVVFGYVDNRKADQIIDQYIRNGEMVEGVIPVNYDLIDNV